MTAFVLKNLELDPDEMLSIVDIGASGNETTRPKVVLVKAKKKKEPFMSFLTKLFSKAEGGEGTSGDMKTPKDIFEEALSGLDEETVMALRLAWDAQNASPAAPPSKDTADGKMEGDPDDEEAAKADESGSGEGASDDEDEKDKKVEEAVKRAVGDTRRDLAKVKKDNDELRKRLAEQEANLAKADIVKRIDRELPYVPGTSAAVATLIMEADGLSDGAQDTLNVLLKSHNALAKKAGLTKERGTRLSDESTPGAPEGRLDAIKAREEKAKEIQKREAAAGRPVNITKARVMADQENPELRTQLSDMARSGVA